jgi:hypothetical protein
VRVDEGVERADGLFVGDFTAGDRIGLKGAAVPDELGFAVGAFCEVLFVVGEDGVAALDVVEFFEDGLGRGRRAVDAEVPLEVADPEDEFGEGGGAGVELDAEDLVGIDGGALQVEEIGVVAEIGRRRGSCRSRRRDRARGRRRAGRGIW